MTESVEATLTLDVRQCAAAQHVSTADVRRALAARAQPLWRAARCSPQMRKEVADHADADAEAETDALRWPRCAPRDPRIAAFLGGGVPVRLGVTELCGEAGASLMPSSLLLYRVSHARERAVATGSGKTQFALGLLLAVQLPLAEGGLDADAIYIATEGGIGAIERRVSDSSRPRTAVN